MAKRVVVQEPAPVAEAKPEVEHAPVDAPFTKEDLDEAWQTYAGQLKASERTAEALALNQPYELRDDYTIKIFLSASVQEEMLEKFRNDFVQHLRKKLNNSQIRLAAEVVQEDTKRRLYTAQEKFQYMAEKNPRLMELKKRLGLDYDY